eukprot:s1407_g5.t1
MIPLAVLVAGLLIAAAGRLDAGRFMGPQPRNFLMNLLSLLPIEAQQLHGGLRPPNPAALLVRPPPQGALGGGLRPLGKAGPASLLLRPPPSGTENAGGPLTGPKPGATGAAALLVRSPPRATDLSSPSAPGMDFLRGRLWRNTPRNEVHRPNAKLFRYLESQAHQSLTAMKCFGLLLVLPLPAFGWWCETSDRHGCRGLSRHFVRDAQVANPFLVFEDIKISYTDEPIVVDWDGDGDLDVILRKRDGLSLFEFKSGRHFVEIEPNPFHGIPGGYCRPAVVDWDGDGQLDLIVGAEDGIRYYQKGLDYKLHQRLGADNPFEHIWTLKGICSDVSIEDWDGDGDLDVLQSSLSSPMQYFENSHGQLVLLEGPNRSEYSSPFHEIANQTVTHRPIMADWNGDGNMDVLLLGKVFDRSSGSEQIFHQQAHCTSYLFEQHKTGGKSMLVFKDEPFFQNEGCISFDGAGASFVDVDGDGDLDAIFGSYEGPLRVYNRTSAGLVKPEFLSNSVPLDRIQLESESPGRHLHFLHPVLADWDWDGDLDLALLHPHDPDKNRYFVHLPDNTVTELNGPPNNSCPINWGLHFSVVDFDGDGKKDLLGFGNLVVVCLQTSSGFVVIEPEEIPFNYFPNCHQCLSNESFYWMGGLLGFPSFLDWDGDGDIDVLRLNLAEKVYLYEQLSNGTVFAHPLPLPSARDFSAADFDGDGDVDIMIIPRWCVSIVDVNDDERLDVVMPPQSPRLAWWTGYETYAFFMCGANGLLVEQLGEANPFDKVAYNKTNNPSWRSVKNLVVDLDGDGDLDIVHGELQYTRNDGGHFTYLNRSDPDHPFRGVQDGEAACWTFVDWDRDGDLDLVQAYHPGGNTVHEVAVHSQWASTIILDMLHNGTSRAERLAWFQKNAYRHMRLYLNAGTSFQEVTGSANPFHDIYLQLTEKSACPTFVDLDKDGVLELVFGTTDGKLQYFKQQNGTFQRVEETPFADLYIRGTIGSFGIFPRFVDWDGDDNMDLVITGTDRVQFFQRGVCKPSISYCKSGVCNQRTSTCKCNAGAEGQDCSLCGNFYVREMDTCRPCPGHNELAGTCSRRGVCEDDADARNKHLAKNLTGFEVTSARGTGQCTCLKPFSGHGCREGQCPAGERLDRHAKVETSTEKYVQWEVCVPCESGKFKNFSPLLLTRKTGLRHFPPNLTICVPCGSGTVSSRDHPETCTPCPEGSVPNNQKNGCEECTGQTYAFEGDEFCRTCFFPALVLMGDENLCTPVYTVLFLFASILFAVCVLAIFGRLRLGCLKRRLKKLVAERNWKDLHTTEARPLEYGLWQLRACKLLALRKAEVKSRSLQLGVSLDYVFTKLEEIYNEKAQQAEWRVDAWGPTTRSGFFVRVRNRGDEVDPDSSWPTLPFCDHPENPNFHQVAAVLAYGPRALGKGLCCPRDGLADCSLVDALETECDSAKATWFLSWALARWWQRHRRVLGAADDAKGIYIWWCLFVNNQFRLLESGQTQDTSDFVHVFGQQVEGIGKMLMCMDKMRGSQYTSRIWCIFEALPDSICRLQIPVGTAGPQLRAADRSGQRRTSTASSKSQWATPDLNREFQIPVGNAGLQLRPDPSGQRRTSTASSRVQWATPDLNRELPIAVGNAGPQPRAPDRSGQRRTSTAR